MNKRNFLKSIGLAGTALVVGKGATVAAQDVLGGPTPCVLVPTEIAGPFPLDLTDNQFYFRQDIREDRQGADLRFRMRVVGNEDCQPIKNARVHIWHCDKDGQYSGYSVGSNPGQADFTYLRGYQITDGQGEVEFITKFPGWYPGRVCHVHFQVVFNSTTAVTSQLTFHEAAKQELYTEHADVYTRGIDPIEIRQDGAFVDGATLQTAELAKTDAVDYTSFLEVTVRGAGVTSVGHEERITQQHFVMGQNFPNPFVDATTIPLELFNDSFVEVTMYDLNGNVIGTIIKANMNAGKHLLQVPADLLVGTSNAAYQAVVVNNAGRWVGNRVLTKRR